MQLAFVFSFNNVKGGWNVKKLLITIVVLLAIPTLAGAKPTQADLNNAKNQMAQYQSEQEKVQAKLDDLNSQIQKIDAEATEITIQKEQVQSQITNKELEISEIKKELDKALADLKNSEERFNSYVKNVYKNGEDDMIAVLFSAKNFSDLIDRMEIAQIIGRINQNIIEELKANKELYEKKSNDLHEEQVKLLDLKSKLDNNIKILEKSKKEVSELILQQQELKKSIDDKLQTSQQEYNDILTSLAAQRSKLALNNIDISNVDLASSNMVAYASNFLGINYVWGGTTPNPGFDCSGFVQYVYRHFGVNISRTTYTQIKDGVEVQKNQLKPGDLIFFGDYNAPHHVAMYAGNGYYIHAPQTGDVIKISKLNPNSSEFCRARRIIN